MMKAAERSATGRRLVERRLLAGGRRGKSARSGRGAVDVQSGLRTQRDAAILSGFRRLEMTLKSER
jgi:hypothetical protein